MSFGELVAKPTRILMVGFSVLSNHNIINANNMEKGRDPKRVDWGAIFIYSNYFLYIDRKGQMK